MKFEPSLFRAYDIRGTFPDQINEELAYAAGYAFVKVRKAQTIVVGRDVRSSGEQLQAAAMRGAIDAGSKVIDIGVISTEMLYFTSFFLDCDGGFSLTASHNPKEWNGMKFIGKNAYPLTKEAGLGEIYDAIIETGENEIEKLKGEKLSQLTVDYTAKITKQDILAEYVGYLGQYIPELLDRPLNVVANTNFGANGKIMDALNEVLKLNITKLNWPADGTFPKGTPDPSLPQNRNEIINTIKSLSNTDYGVAWDADADRCFFYDETGRPFHSAYITALLISYFLEKEPGASIVLERRLVRANLAAVEEGKGEYIFSRTGHGYIKKAMRDHEAIFGGESSGHFYFRDFSYADNGLITFLVVTGIFAKQIKKGLKVSDLLDSYLEKFPIGLQEMNFITEKADQIIDEASKANPKAEQNHEDGLTVDYPDWRFNLRSSSNEPIMRLNIEATSQTLLDTKLQEMLDFILSKGAKLRDDN